ncbi:Thioredoxin-like fold [Pseudocohnilembus persalinus]|uniref:protein-disulfide reductase n=1 Tax=Pseudocohnilembus persalinus TaxID=266149 RepID=A0A0V0QM36_PSEPJ|nr:Thioredoxin-like fold [Pseudocohnilembus persalinus]|eukprot:KRX03284.1 Thioredoxin-like fold [Pseudocohnilembus persalinus]
MEQINKKKNILQIGVQFEGKNGLLEYNPLKNNKITCLYFSASYSPPCQAFTPLLSEFYNEVNSEDKVLEIILISLDKNKSDFQEYFSQMNWLAIPFDDSQNRTEKCVQQFQVEQIPKLIPFRPNGQLITKNGRQDVINDGIAAFDNWLKENQTEI